MNDEVERSATYIIPKNYEDSFITASGISFRSIAEGALLLLLSVPIFIFIPIPMMYRWMLIAILGGLGFVFGVMGIKHCFLSEFIYVFLRFKSSSQTVIRNDDDIYNAFLKVVTKDEFSPVQEPEIEEKALSKKEIKQLKKARKKQKSE